MLERTMRKVLDYLSPKKSEYSVKSIARMPNRENHSALTCTPLLEIYGSLFCVDNYRIVFKDDNKDLKVLIPVEVLPRTKGENFEAYSRGDGFAIRYGDHDYFFLAKFEIIEVYGMRIFDIKQEAIEAVFHEGELCHLEDIKGDRNETITAKRPAIVR